MSRSKVTLVRTNSLRRYEEKSLRGIRLEREVILIDKAGSYCICVQMDRWICMQLKRFVIDYHKMDKLTTLWGLSDSFMSM